MSDLGKWQTISFISRGAAVLLGLVQSFVIIRLLSLSEWGIVQLAVSIGGALGIYQHLGLASASTREIAAAKNDKDIFKIFVTSVVIRYIVSIPIAIGLFFSADYIAVNIYKNSLLVFPLKLYAISLLVLGVQSIFNSIISGTQRFKRLFIYQVAVAFLNIVIFLPLVFLYKINGYFIAYLLFNVVNSLVLGYLALRPLKGNLVFPGIKDLQKMFKQIFTISMAIYFVKILSTNWEKLGPNLLGLYTTPEVLAVFAFALLYAKKILNISDAVTDVNLPVLSEKFSNDVEDFKKTFRHNFDKVFGFIILSSAAASFWAPQIISLLVGDKYAQAYQYIPFALLAFVLYSIIDIVKSSIFVPARLTSVMIFSYVILILSTAILYLGLNGRVAPLFAMAIAMALGVVFATIYIIRSINTSLHFKFFITKHWVILLQATLFGWGGIYLSLVYKALVFPVAYVLIIYALFITKIFTYSDLQKVSTLWKKLK